MKEIDEVRKGFVEMNMEGRICKGKLELSIASINDLLGEQEALTETRITEMAAKMTGRDRQADERLKLLYEMMRHRDTYVDKRISWLQFRTLPQR